jgi:hypothetical protein
MLLELHMLLQHLLLPEHPWPAWKQGTHVGPSQIRPAQQLSGTAVQATPCNPQAPPSVPVSLPAASCEASLPPESFPAEASVALPLDEPPPLLDAPLLDALPLEPPAPLELAPPLELPPPPELTPPLELPPAASEPELSTLPEEPQAAPSTAVTATTNSRRNERFIVWRSPRRAYRAHGSRASTRPR